MNLVEELSKYDIALFENYVDSWATENAHRTASGKFLLREWADKKQDLYKLFGEKFDISKEFETKKTDKNIYDDFSCYLNYFPRSDIANFMHDVSEVLHEANRNGCNSYSLRDHINRLKNAFFDETVIADNTYYGEDFKFKVPNGTKEIVVQHGMKFTKLLGKIAKEANISGYDDFCTAYSRILNDKTLKGEVHLSIHPMDYATMSDNDNNWTSCMSWQEQGCYRQGTVEMMNSPWVVVAYVPSTSTTMYNGWNSKKWRELFIVHPNLIFGIKGYPYQNKELERFVVNWLREISGADNYYETMVERNYDDFCYNNENYNIRLRTGYMYNDIINNTKEYTFAIGKNMPCDFQLNYSGESECMACGQIGIRVEDNGMLLGECCGFKPFGVCDYCGDDIDYEDDAYVVDGETLCRCCYEDETENCVVTDEIHLINNMTRVYIVKDLEHIISSPYIWVFNYEVDHPSCCSQYLFGEKPYNVFKDGYYCYYYVELNSIRDWGRIEDEVHWGRVDEEEFLEGTEF